ncbi:MAG: hypothetical protein OEN48_18790 [Betaproteobacteria bacterium]|nr:hypothetical protein [Betaproteobacteria bacterium]
MREVFSRLERTGLSMKAFAAREGISYTTMQYWRRRLGGGRKKTADRQKTVVLSPVRVVPDAAPPAERKGFEVWLSNGVSVEVPAGFDEGELQRLVGVLSGC